MKFHTRSFDATGQLRPRKVHENYMKFAFTLEAGHHIALLLIKSILIAFLQWTDPASLEYCLMAASAELVSKASVSPRRFSSHRSKSM